MKDSNKLFVLSTMIVFFLLISINYNSINDYYLYSVQLNSLVVGPNFFGDPEQFKKISEDKESTCFTTLNENFFCYGKPRIHDEYPISTVIGPNGIDGEIHFDPVDKGVSYFTMKNMTLAKGDTSLITFADNDYHVGNATFTKYEITEDFEFATTIEKFDSFIAKCNNYEGTSVTIVQYLGITTIDGIDYFMTWHMLGHSEPGVSCNYPQIIKHSLEHNFREL